MMDTLWNKRQQMRTMDELAEFYSQFRREKDRFMATANSFAVDMRMKKRTAIDPAIWRARDAFDGGQRQIPGQRRRADQQLRHDAGSGRSLVASELAEQAERQASLN